jgi:predicted secreted Zn-dependent protease
MVGRIAALALAIGLVLGACLPWMTQVPPTSSPSAVGAATPTPGPSGSPQPPAPTPPTILAIATAQRPTGPWAVTFQLTGTEAIREVYVLSAACPDATCDIDATIQTFDGDPIGTTVFRFSDGMYRSEEDRTDTIDCEDGFGTVAGGASRTSHTSLLIAGYRPVGSAAITVDIRGTRSVRISPIGASGCAVESLDYLANGRQTEFAAAPTPTPKPPTTPQVSAIPSSFFGSGAKVQTYGVTGRTREQISASISANGPWSDWLHGHAEALTKAVPKYRFTLAQSADQCRIVVTAKPAVVFSYTITLPSWTKPKNADPSTVRWWSAEIVRVATHERHHVEIYRDGATRMTAAIADSTCANVSAHLSAIVHDIDVEQCQFDLDEYGTALGLSLSSCLAQ